MEKDLLYNWYNQKKHDVLAVTHNLEKLLNDLGFNSSDGDKRLISKVQGLRGRLMEERLSAMLVGTFSAGKSSFLNALNGTKLLPSSPTPTTGVICELRYADEAHKRVTLYPKKGCGPNGSDKPFVVNMQDLKKELKNYVKLNHADSDTPSDKETSRYHKVLIEWPIALCKNNISLIDSVGLDDPEERDAITLDYAKDVDVVLYCMTANSTYSATDKRILLMLERSGFKNILFVITHMGNLKQNQVIDDEEDDDGSAEAKLEAFKAKTAEELQRHTELGKKGILYVDSKDALMAETSSEHAQGSTALAESGIPHARSVMERFLVQEKGCAKLDIALTHLRQVSEDLCGRMTTRIQTFKQDEETFRKKYALAKKMLLIKMQEKDSMTSSFNSEMELLKNRLADEAADFIIQLITDLPKNINHISLPSLSNFAFKADYEEATQTILKSIKGYIDGEVCKWVGNTMVNDLQEGSKQAYKRIETRVQDYLEKLVQIQDSLMENKKGLSSNFMAIGQNLSHGNIDIGAELYRNIFSNSLVLGGGVAVVVTLAVAVFAFAWITVPVGGFIASQLFSKRQEAFKSVSTWSAERLRKKVVEKYIEASLTPETRREVRKQVISKLEGECAKISASLTDYLGDALERVKSNAEQAYAVMEQGEKKTKQAEEEYEKAISHVREINNKLQIMGADISQLRKEASF